MLTYSLEFKTSIGCEIKYDRCLLDIEIHLTYVLNLKIYPLVVSNFSKIFIICFRNKKY